MKYTDFFFPSVTSMCSIYLTWKRKNIICYTGFKCKLDPNHTITISLLLKRINQIYTCDRILCISLKEKIGFYILQWVELRIIMLSKIKNNLAQNIYVIFFFEIHSYKIKDTFFFSQNHIGEKYQEAELEVFKYMRVDD